jgi:hypothetical protein
MVRRLWRSGASRCLREDVEMRMTSSHQAWKTKNQKLIKQRSESRSKYAFDGTKQP